MTVSDAVEKLRNIPSAEAVLRILAEVDTLSFNDGELEFPVPMAGNDHFQEAITALLNRLSARL